MRKTSKSSPTFTGERTEFSGRRELRDFCVNACTVLSLDYLKGSRSLWLQHEAKATDFREARIPAPV